VLNRDVEVAGAPQASALGAAMLGAVAAGATAGGYDTLSAAASHMAPAPVRVFHPVPSHVATYERLFQLYRDLYDDFGRRSRVMKELRHLRA
jgi:L-ribulokinase